MRSTQVSFFSVLCLQHTSTIGKSQTVEGAWMQEKVGGKQTKRADPQRAQRMEERDALPRKTRSQGWRTIWRGKTVKECVDQIEQIKEMNQYVCNVGG